MSKQLLPDELLAIENTQPLLSRSISEQVPVITKVERFDISSEKYEALEDPLTGAAVPKDEFYKIYKAFIDSLECYVEDFYEHNPLVHGQWRFIDSDAREDFFEGCQQKGLLLQLSEHHAGESHQQKKQRDEQKSKCKVDDADVKKAMAKQRMKLGEKKKQVHAQSAASKEKHLQQTRAKLESQLKSMDKSDIKYTALEQKLTRVLMMLEQTM